MKKAQLQEIKARLDSLEPTGDIADYNAELEWFWESYPPPAHRTTANNHVFDRFSFQAFERLGLNVPNQAQTKTNERICAEFEVRRRYKGEA